MMKLILCLQLVPLLAIAQIHLPDELIEALPSPIAYLQRADTAGSILQDGLLGYLKYECRDRLSSKSTGFKDSGDCEIIALFDRYTRLVALLNRGDQGVVTLPNDQFNLDGEELRPKPWALTELLSGNFMLAPDPISNSGFDLIIELFETRHKILGLIDRVFAKAIKRNVEQPEIYIRRAFWHAYIKSVTPVGALGLVFSNIKCGIRQRGCEVAKSLWGAVCHIASEDNALRIQDLDARFRSATQVGSSEALTRLRAIVELGEIIEQPSLDIERLKLQVTKIEGNGLGSFNDIDYANLARATLIYLEIKSLFALRENCSPYAIDLSPRKMNEFRSQLQDIMKEPIDQLEVAMKMYGLMHEEGGN